MFDNLSEALAAYDRALYRLEEDERMFGEGSEQYRIAMEDCMRALMEYDLLLCRIPQEEYAG
jgi:hypothetical protein